MSEVKRGPKGGVIGLDDPRELPSRAMYVANLCPSCGAQQDGTGEAHFKRCPAEGKVFAVEQIFTVPASELSDLQARLSRAEEALRGLVSATSSCPDALMHGDEFSNRDLQRWWNERAAPALRDAREALDASRAKE